MNSLGKIVAVVTLGAVTVLASAFRPVNAEPLMTLFTFSQSAYDDRGGNEIVVTITRTDQDPATENQEFAVNCQLTGGDAVANQDYRLSFNGAMWGLGKVTFPPGVHEQSFTVYTYNTSGPNKTLTLALSDPQGPAPVVTGENPTTSVTIVNQ
jgi:hypothetical protein